MMHSEAELLAPLALKPGERVLLSAHEHYADRLSAAIERLTGQRPLQAGAAEDSAGAVPSEVDALVLTTVNPAASALLMSGVRRQGRVLLLIPAGSHVRAFDFYSSVHRTSIAFFVRRVPMTE